MYSVQPTYDGLLLVWHPADDAGRARIIEYLMDHWARMFFTSVQAGHFTNGTILQIVPTTRIHFERFRLEQRFARLLEDSRTDGLLTRPTDDPIIWVPDVVNKLSLIWEPSSDEARHKVIHELMPEWQQLASVSTTYNYEGTIVLLLDVPPLTILDLSLRRDHQDLMKRSMEAGLLENPGFFI